jgi:hypothetical protein
MKVNPTELFLPLLLLLLLGKRCRSHEFLEESFAGIIIWTPQKTTLSAPTSFTLINILFLIVFPYSLYAWENA